MAQLSCFLLLKIENSKNQLINANQYVIYACCLKRARFLIVNLHFKWPLLEMQELPSECYQYKSITVFTAAGNLFVHVSFLRSFKQLLGQFEVFCSEMTGVRL